MSSIILLFATSLSGAFTEEPADIVAIALGERDETIVASIVDDRGRVAIVDTIGDTLAETSFDTEILDLAATADASRIVVLRTDAVVLLEPTLAVVWEQRLPAAIDDGHIAIGEEGTIAVATDDRVRSIATDGRAGFDVATGLSEVTALAVLDDGLVVTGGTRERSSRAALVAREPSGAMRWDLWSGTTTEAPVTAIVDARRGGDGELYVVADADGPGEGHTRVAWFARAGADGTLHATGTLGFDAPYSTVRADAIAADALGNVLLVGASTHEIEDGVAIESPRGVTGWYRMLGADLRTQIVSREFAVEDLDGDRNMLVAGDHRAVAMTPAVDDDPARIVLLPTHPDQTKKEKTPDRDDVGTFGYESGASGIDPTCYCDAKRETSPGWWAATIALVVLGRPRRRVG
jgi:hypothetical protein